MKWSTFSTITILVLLLVCAFCVTYYLQTRAADAPNADAQTDLQTSETAVYTDLEGNPFTFNAYEGKVRVVNVWGSWSPFSRQELQNLEVIAEEFKDTGVVVIAINRKEPKEFAKGYLATLQTFTNVLFVIDVTDAFYASIEGYAMPETVFYDARGNMTFHKRGEMTLEEIRIYTQEAIQKEN